MGYRRYRRPAHPTTTFDRAGNEVDLTDKAIKTRIEKVIPLVKKANDSWAEEFLTSINGAFDKYNRLTPKQYEWLAKLEYRHSPDRKAKTNAWRQNFSAEMREKMTVLAKSQKAENTAKGQSYWSDMIEKILSDDTYIPTEKAFRKFTENRYAEGKLRAMNEKPKFSVGCVVAASSARRGPHFDAAIVVAVDHEPPTSHARGAKKYLVMPHGGTTSITVEEREIKRYRQPKKKAA